MSKFCNSCGAQIPDTANNCPSCGAPQVHAAPVTPVAPAAAPASAAPSSAVNNKTIFAIIGAVVAVVLIIILIINLFGGGYESPVKNMFAGIEKGDWKKFSSALPPDMVEKMEKNFDKMDIKDGDEFMKDNITKKIEKQYGDKVKISYKVLDKIKLESKEISNIEDNFESTYDEKIDIKEGYELALKIEIKGNDDKETSFTNIQVGKIGSKWYVLDSSFTKSLS